MQRIPLREAWASEAGDFTPWLAEAQNLSLLSEAIGIDLELESQEKPVGPFRADILCRDSNSNSWVLIENQLERTDHIHLGQLLTYAAGLDAVTIVWIADKFTEEHRAALDWLNEHTSEGINFFGLEVELWRIGDSPLAPKFNVVCKPNEWTKAVTRPKETSENSELCHAYWSGVIEALRPSGILDESAKPARKQDISLPVGWSSFRLKAYFSRPSRKLGIWIRCRGDNGVENFRALQLKKADIESRFGSLLEWNEGENHGSIFKGFDNCDPTDREDWPRQHQFLAEQLLALRKAAHPLIQQIEAAEAETQR